MEHIRISSPQIGLADLIRACDCLRPTNTDAVYAIAAALGLIPAVTDSVRRALCSDGGSPASVAASGATGLSVSVNYDIGMPSSEHDANAVNQAANTLFEHDGSPMTPEEEAVFDGNDQWTGESGFRSGLRDSRDHVTPEGFQWRPKRAVSASPIERSPSESMPAKFGLAPIWSMEDHQTESQHCPLLPPSLVRAWLRDLVVSPAAAGQVDQTRLVEIVARGSVSERIPRLKIKQLRRLPSIVMDVSESMAPFLDDQKALASVARRTLGCGDRQLLWVREPEEVGVAEIGAAAQAARLDGETLVIVSTVGKNEIGTRERRWHVVLAALIRRGARIVILEPGRAVAPTAPRIGPAVRWVPWIPPNCQPRRTCTKDLDTLAVAMYMSSVPTFRLLRHARLALLPGLEPYAEALFLTRGYVIGAMRQRIILSKFALTKASALLAGDPLLRGQIVTLCQEWRDKQSERRDDMRFDERSAALGAERILVSAWAGDHDESEELFRGIVRTLYSREKDQGFARFINSVLLRLPPEARESELGRLVAFQVKIALQQQISEHLIAATARHHGWLFQKSAVIGMAWNGARLMLRDRPRSGDALIEVPDTERRNLYISWSDGEMSKSESLWRGGRLVLKSPKLPALISSMSATKYLISEPEEEAFWGALAQSKDGGRELSGRVITEVTKDGRLDGYLVDVGILVFLPMARLRSSVALGAVGDFLGMSVSVVVIELERSSRTVVVADVECLQEDRFWGNPQGLEVVKIGTLHRCTILNVTPKRLVVSLQAGCVGIVSAREFEAFETTAPRIGESMWAEVRSVNAARRELHLEPTNDRVYNWQTALPTVGAVLECKIVKVVDYGIFVDAGGLSGLIHETELSWSRPKQTSAAFKAGEELKAMVLGVDTNKRRLSLGVKQLMKDPMENAEGRYPIGQAVVGRVSSVADYGLFVEVEEGLEGLLHISKITGSKSATTALSDARSFLNNRFPEGSEITVCVDSIDVDKRRIALSLSSR